MLKYYQSAIERQVMSALLVKDAPEGLHQWLKSEASFNRRSLNQQVLVCLEWCMQTYGEARQRDPFAEVTSRRCRLQGVQRTAASTRHPYAHGPDLAARLASLEPIDAETAKQMRDTAKSIRLQKIRKFDYACFD